MSAIRRCPDHGVFEAGERGDGETCPVCGARGAVVLESEKRVRLSKFLSGALRHFPGDVGIALDERGWTPYEDVLDTVTDRYPWADREALDALIATDPKGRFERESGKEGDMDERGGEWIRASYGHSVAVTLGEDEEGDGTNAIPDRLFHGTAPRNREAIREKGLSPMGRRKVHLSDSPERAREVGARHASAPIVFAVDTEALIASGHPVTERGRGVYTTDRVPPAFLAGPGNDGE